MTLMKQETVRANTLAAGMKVMAGERMLRIVKVGTGRGFRIADEAGNPRTPLMIDYADGSWSFVLPEDEVTILS